MRGHTTSTINTIIDMFQKKRMHVIFILMGIALCAVASAQNEDVTTVSFEFSVLLEGKQASNQQLFYRSEEKLIQLNPSFVRISPVPYDYTGDGTFSLYKKIEQSPEEENAYKLVGQTQIKTTARRLLFYLRQDSENKEKYLIAALDDSKKSASNIRFWNQTGTDVYGQIGEVRWKLENGKMHNMPVSSKNSFEGVLLRLNESNNSENAEVTHFQVGSPKNRERTLVIILPPHPYSNRGGLGIRIYQY